METESFKNRASSRKFLLMLGILMSSTVVLTLPFLAKLLGGVDLSPMMAGGEYVTLLIGTFGIYSGANVVQKKVVHTADTGENR